MGKKRITESAPKKEGEAAAPTKSAAAKKRVDVATLYVQSTYNNTALSLTDKAGNVLVWSSSGALGFKGAKKGTPFAASKIAELIGEKAQQIGLKEVSVIVKGVGSGRESAIRTFSAFGIEITKIVDKTPVPHNGPKPRKPRHV